MRPLRFLLTLASCILAFFLLLYIGPWQDRAEEEVKRPTSLSAYFNWRAPSAFFQPSAIISLTDDNSTFFLARPAAFGPLLPAHSLSGQLWVGIGFGSDRLGRSGVQGELGCSDIPGWEDRAYAGRWSKSSDEATSLAHGNRRRREVNSADDNHEGADGDDGTDEHLHRQFPALDESGNHNDGLRGTAMSIHADIQSMQESAEIAGKIVLLSRGGCGFLDKVKWVQRRGGVALIVGDDIRGEPLATMYARGDASNVTIPSLFTSYTTAHLLTTLMPPETFTNSIALQAEAKSGLVKEDRGTTNLHDESSENETEHPNFTTTPFVASSSLAAAAVASTPPLSDDVVPSGFNGGSITPGSGEYDNMREFTGRHVTQGSHRRGSAMQTTDKAGVIGLLATLFGLRTADGSLDSIASQYDSAHSLYRAGPSSYSTDEPEVHEGLWVTLTPAAMSSSPFFDTLLVLVVSPLVTLSVVYALLLLRSRIRRRRWRAPKSVVEQLPVRTYQTMSSTTATSSTTSSISARITASTPLLPSEARPIAARQKARSRSTSEIPVQPSSSMRSDGMAPPPLEQVDEKRAAGLEEWRRRYGGKQRECVVCLEEYVDGVSRVMSLPCGHEFHAECM